MKKAIFFTSFLLVITLVMLFDLKKTRSREYSVLEPPPAPPTRGRDVKLSQTNDLNDLYLKISFLDVGQGDASFIEWPDNTQMLVDCARDAAVLPALGRVMKYYDREIDYLVVTHPDLDHYGGCIDVLKRFEVKNIVYTGLQKEDKSWQYFWDMIQKENAQYFEIAKSDIWQINGATVNFLYPDKPINEINAEKDNNASIVFKLSYGESDVLFTGDAEIELEKHLLQKYGEKLNSEVLKVGHHGSGSSSSQEFLKIVSPDFSTISVGKDNDYGHPSIRVIKRLERVGSEVWRTDKTGDIILQVGEDNVVVK